MSQWIRRATEVLKSAKIATGVRKILPKNVGKIDYRRVGFIFAGTSITTTYGVLVLYAESIEEKPKKKLVILGSGWGAVSLIKSLKPGEFDVSVVSPENYFLFTPLLPSVTVGTVEGRSITEPIRKILAKRHKHGAKFYEGQCTEIDIEGNTVKCKDLSGIVLLLFLSCTVCPK